MSSRTYLSIGDVLTLLREEFPDVTISKIRFLESQGLVNPERSPSGYRKFFDHDVERLRWVLRQQREHFLPLKVIRDRLADGDLDDDIGAERPNGKAAQPAHAVAVAGVASGHAHEQPTKADEEAMARILADASRRAARLPEEKQARPGLQVVAEADEARGAAVESAAPRKVASATPRRTPAERRHDATTTLGGRSASPPPAAPPPTGRANGAALHRAPDAPPPPRPAPTPSAASARKGDAKTDEVAPVGAPGPAAMVTGASLSADELCAATGLSLDELAGLKGFGLVECVMVAGIETYDEDALTVANLAAAFRAFGIEPRHLRLYRNAADRELGLIEQVVIPLLRQRNPESSQRAVDGADQLAALGQSMRATLLRQALRRHLGG
ncbi:MAG TPA: MerR family transcriptional regulator [Acidimicrobiales bacterium]|nr:MerR family transcriptional regulator [Acidimicrobiales bacterium]